MKSSVQETCNPWRNGRTFRRRQKFYKVGRSLQGIRKRHVEVPIFHKAEYHNAIGLLSPKTNKHHLFVTVAYLTSYFQILYEFLWLFRHVDFRCSFEYLNYGANRNLKDPSS